MHKYETLLVPHSAPNAKLCLLLAVKMWHFLAIFSHQKIGENSVFCVIDYATWFLESSNRPIIDDYPVGGGRVLGGIARALQASKARLRLHVETLQLK